MIRIYSAKPGALLAYTGTFGFGPFSPDGGDLFDTFSTRSSFDSLRERPGIYGENHVNHRELHAYLYTNPWRGVYSASPSALVSLYKRNSSGAWLSSTARIYERDMLPAYPWTLTSSPSATTRPQFYRKLSPNQIDSVDVRWYYVASRARWEIEQVVHTELTCETPGPGATSANATRRTHKSTYRKPIPDIWLHSSPTPDKTIRLLEKLMQVARSDNPGLPSSLSYAYPFYSKSSLGIETTPRETMIRLQSVTEDRHEVPDDIKSFGELAGEAIDTLDSNSVNMFEFLQGFKRPADLIPKLKNLSQLKTHAGNYLAVQYGILPTVSDLETLKEAILGHAKPYFDSNSYQVLTAGHSVSRSGDVSLVTQTNRVKVALNNADPRLYSLSEKLRDIGGFPSIDNLWDLVPYSFVVDWFINVGDMLEGLDDRFRISKLPVVYATTSSKIVIIPYRIEDLTALGVSGDIQIVYYDRSVSRKAPVPPLNFEVSNELPANWLEAAALIAVARK